MSLLFLAFLLIEGAVIVTAAYFFGRLEGLASNCARPRAKLPTG